jgi:3-phenylpropionate/cinnamic acid dioxygenase small subunit
MPPSITRRPDVVDTAPDHQPTTFADWHAIHTLLMTYAEHVDAGRFADVAAMFEHATYRVARSDADVSSFEGTEQVQAFCEQTRLYPDGTPRTNHVITNVVIDVDGDRAHSRCYATVFQQTDALPLQPIASGRYVDRFARVGDEWQFADRLITGFLLGDRRQHVVWHAGTPEDATS